MPPHLEPAESAAPIGLVVAPAMVSAAVWITALVYALWR